MNRKAHFAGSWYPDAPLVLEGLLEDAYAAAGSAAVGAKAGRSAILPHAGLRYSAPCIARGLAALDLEQAGRVLVLAPSHNIPLSPGELLCGDFDELETPLGPLKSWLPRGWASSNTIISREHAVEMVLPFLRHANPALLVAVALCGKIRTMDDLRLVSGAIDSLGEDVVLIGSSDMSHYGPRFSDTSFDSGMGAFESVEARDRAALNALCEGKAENFLKNAELWAPSMCGRDPALVVASLARSRAQTARTLAWYCSFQADAATQGHWPGDFVPAPPENFVSYAAVVFESP